MTEEEKESFKKESTPAPEVEPEAESTLEVDRSVLKPAAEPVAEQVVEQASEPTASGAESGTTIPEAATAAAVAPIEKKPVPWALYTRLTGFVSMLVLAIVGMHFIRISYDYVWIYWVSVVLVFMVISFARGYQGSKLRGETLSSSLTRHFMHWGGLIIVVGIMMILQNYERIDVNVAANILLLLLALTCYLAGVHFDRLFIVIGIFLGVVALLATLKNDAIIWGVSVLVALGALGVAFLYFRSESPKDDAA